MMINMHERMSDFFQLEMPARPPCSFWQRAEDFKAELARCDRIIKQIPTCVLCEEPVDEWHMNSCGHVLRAQAHAALTQLLGSPLWGLRPYGQGLRHPDDGLLQLRDLEMYWGGRVSQLASDLRDRLRATGVWWRTSSCCGRVVAVLRAEVAFVSYEGPLAPKKNRQHSLVYLKDLPTQLPQWLLTDKSLSWWPVLALDLAGFDSPEVSEEHEILHIISLTSEPAPRAAAAASGAGGRKALVCCQELLQERPAAWPVSFRRH